MEISKIKPTNYVYNKKQMIGKGAFGEVYLGYNGKEHFPVAVKIVSFQKISPVMNKQTVMSKLKQEIINMQIAKNQNLVQLLDAQVSSRNLYIICQYCNGESFDNFLKRKGYLTETEALIFFKQILKGFQNLHNKKIVHRDLKPANLLMHNFSIKIADLGFSKSIDQHEQLLQSIVGTPLYMSPQIFNKQKYTEKTDIWSLGVIMYEMLYGRIPWRAKSLLQLKEKVQNQTVEFPQSPIVTINTKYLIQSMLQLQENKRVGWEQLFSKYIPKSTFQSLQNNLYPVMEEQKQFFMQSFQKMFKYVNSSFYIQSQHQLVKTLIDLGIKKKQEIQIDSSYDKAEEFFASKLFIDKKKLEILSYCFYFFGRRNRISFMFKIFQLLFNIISKLSQSQQIDSIQIFAEFYAAQLLVIKFAIHSLHKMLNRDIDTDQQKKVAVIVESGPCQYPRYIQFLLKNDLLNFKDFFQIFMKQYYINKMKVLQSVNLDLFNQINKQLGGLYTNQIGDYKFVKFMLGNSLKSVFNRLKYFKQKSQQVLMATRMIYQIQKDESLFDLGNLMRYYEYQINYSNRSSLLMEIAPTVKVQDLNKKLNEWKNDQKWKAKLSQLSQFKIESLSTFISKQFKWNPIHSYATDIL